MCDGKRGRSVSVALAWASGIGWNACVRFVSVPVCQADSRTPVFRLVQGELDKKVLTKDCFWTLGTLLHVSPARV